MATTSPPGDTTDSPGALKAAWRAMKPPVFIPASIVIFGLIIFSVIFSSTAENAFTNLNSAISSGIGWWYILAVTGFVVFAPASPVLYRFEHAAHVIGCPVRGHFDAPPGV